MDAFDQKLAQAVEDAYRQSFVGNGALISVYFDTSGLVVTTTEAMGNQQLDLYFVATFHRDNAVFRTAEDLGTTTELLLVSWLTATHPETLREVMARIVNYEAYYENYEYFGKDPDPIDFALKIELVLETYDSYLSVYNEFYLAQVDACVNRHIQDIVANAIAEKTYL